MILVAKKHLINLDSIKCITTVYQGEGEYYVGCFFLGDMEDEENKGCVCVDHLTEESIRAILEKVGPQ